jgi:hypothetical protein
VSLGPSLWLLAHFDLTIRLQICRNNPYFTVGVAAIHVEVLIISNAGEHCRHVQLAAAHLLVVGDGVDPGARCAACRFLGEADAVVDGIPRKHEHAAPLLFAPNKHVAICAAAEERAACDVDADDCAAVTA